MNEQKEIIKSIINAIDNKNLDLKNVPELKNLIQAYIRKSNEKVDNVSNEAIRNIKNISNNEFDKYSKAIDKQIHDDYHNFVLKAEYTNHQGQLELQQKYQALINNLNNDDNIGTISKQIKSDLQKDLQKLNDLSKDIDLRTQKINEKMEKLEKMTYFKRFSSMLSVFLGAMLPVLFVFAIVCCFIYFIFSKFG